jgi:plastocyanin
VNGTQFLSAGSYAFFCSVHGSSMSGTLNVTGTPLAKPAVALKVRSKSLDQALRKDEVKVKATITGGSGQEAAAVDLRLGKKKIGVTQTTTTTRVLKIPLTSKGQNLLEDRSSAKLKAGATIEFGDPASAKGTLK